MGDWKHTRTSWGGVIYLGYYTDYPPAPPSTPEEFDAIIAGADHGWLIDDEDGAYSEEELYAQGCRNVPGPLPSPWEGQEDYAYGIRTGCGVERFEYEEPPNRGILIELRITSMTFTYWECPDIILFPPILPLILLTVPLLMLNGGVSGNNQSNQQKNIWRRRNGTERSTD